MSSPGPTQGSWTFINNTGVDINIGLFWDGFLTEGYRNSIPTYSQDSCGALPTASQMFGSAQIAKMVRDNWITIQSTMKLPVYKAKDGSVLGPGKSQWVVYPMAVAYDVVATYSTPESMLNPDDNWSRWSNIGLTVAGIAEMAIGAVLEPVTGGASTALLVTGVITTVASVGLDVASSVVPCTFKGWYGANHYLCVVNGGIHGRATGKGDGVEITSIDPLTVNWMNTTTGQHGVVTAT